MNKTEKNQTSNAEMVTISRAEYEEFQAQRKKISELESRVDLLMEALRLARHLTWLLKAVNNADLSEPQTVQTLLPWNAPAECRIK